MTGTTLDQLRIQEEYHKEMVSIHERGLETMQGMIADTKAAEEKLQKGLSNGKGKGRKTSIPKSPTQARRGPGRPAGSKINKSEEIRAVFRKKPSIDNKDVVTALSKRGIDVTDGLVSIVKKKFFESDDAPKRGKKGKKTQARKRASSKSSTSASAKRSPRKKARGKGELKIIIQEILGKPEFKQGLKLADLSEEIIKAGYKTTSSKGIEGLPQIVYQTLRGMQEGKLIVHNKKSHRYRLKKKRNAA
jgi:hypothetical protein